MYKTAHKVTFFFERTVWRDTTDKEPKQVLLERSTSELMIQVHEQQLKRFWS